MTGNRPIFASLLLAFGIALRGSAADAPTPAPDFKEVYDLIRAHVEGLTEEELNRAAVQALVSAVGPKVSLVGAQKEADGPEAAPLVSRSELFDGAIAYVRVGRVATGLAKAVRDACEQVAATNQLSGVVLDLRYAHGDDYAAAAETADLFLKQERPLLDWGKGVVRSKEKSDALSVPVTVLIHRQTAGAAEAVAAVLRETGAGLLLGSKTAGQAMIAQDYPVKGGGSLRIASSPVLLGDGSALSPQGIKPDITIEVSAQDERAYFADAFKEIPRANFGAGGPSSSTNIQVGAASRTRRQRFNEAELVRARKEGFNLEGEIAGDGVGEPERPVVRDPVLARALDVLKGLALVRRSRS